MSEDPIDFRVPVRLVYKTGDARLWSSLTWSEVEALVVTWNKPGAADHLSSDRTAKFALGSAAQRFISIYDTLAKLLPSERQRIADLPESDGQAALHAANMKLVSMYDLPVHRRLRNK